VGKDQLAVLGGLGLQHPRAPRTSASLPADQAVPHHPLSTLALATSVRLDDPLQEHERVVMVEVAIVAGREAARALDRWLSQSLTECRGSRSAWDLEATTTELRFKLDQFDVILRETADRLIRLIPGLVDEMPGLVSLSASTAKRRRNLNEVAAASKLLNAIEARSKSEQGPASADQELEDRSRLTG
jgi:hypothetical protein